MTAFGQDLVAPDGDASVPRHSDAPRFVAYDLAYGGVVLTGTHVRHMLNFMRDHLWPQVDERTVEILDCGEGAPDASAVTLPLDEARARFATVFRGDGAPGLPAVALDVVPGHPPRP